MIIIKFLSWDAKIKVTTELLSNKGIQTLNQVPHSLLVSPCLMPDLNVIHCSTHYVTSYRDVKTHKPIGKGETLKNCLYHIDTAYNRSS